MADVRLRLARPDEAPMLSELALRSKAHWGYDDDFIEACREELTVGRAEIDANRVVVAVVDATVVGTFTLDGEPPVGDVEMFFVEPAHIGTGVGGLLFAELRRAAAATGFNRLRIEADPNALGFYEHEGAVLVGEVASASIPGRMLPLLELDLSAR